MPFDHAARSKQLGAVLDHSGTALSFTDNPGVTISFKATIVDRSAEPEAHDNDKSDDVAVTISASRAAFTGEFPRNGQYFVDPATATKYRIGAPLSAVSNPLAVWRAIEL